MSSDSNKKKKLSKKKKGLKEIDENVNSTDVVCGESVRDCDDFWNYMNERKEKSSLFKFLVYLVYMSCIDYNSSNIKSIWLYLYQKYSD
nr:829_t:CDS:2 [Entrophospora candida]